MSIPKPTYLLLLIKPLFKTTTRICPVEQSTAAVLQVA